MNRKIRITVVSLILVCGTVLWAKRPNDGETPTHAMNVSLVRVIATPNELDGQRLRVCGYLGYNGIDRSLGVYISEIDGRNGIISNSVSLSIEPSRVGNLIGRYVIFSGVFHAAAPQTGENGFFDQIRDIVEWEKSDRVK